MRDKVGIEGDRVDGEVMKGLDGTYKGDSTVHSVARRRVK